MGALEGIRVVDVGLLVQGPQAGLLLADLGADVIKVELPAMGDQARWIPAAADDPRPPYYIACNRGKRSVTLDLRLEAARDAFIELVKSADVLLSNFKPGTLEEWGLGWEVLHDHNPRLVFAAGSVFGPNGPDAQREGADLAAQAAGGLISTTGVDGGPPTPVGATMADHIASQNMSNGILAALIARQRTGEGQRVDVSLLGGQIYAQASEYTAHFLTGDPNGRSNYGHPLLNAAYGIVPTSDGYIAIVGVPPAQRDAFYAALDRPELADDERFQPLLYDAETKMALFEILNEIFPARSTAEWSERLSAANTRFAPVRNYAEATQDVHAWENGYIIEVDHPEWGTIPMIGCPIALSATPAEPGHFAPELGQHTEEVLLEVGLDWDDIAALQQAGAV